MKKTLNTPRVLSSMVAVALLGLFVGSPAWGEDLFGTYRIQGENSTNAGEHHRATYVIYKSKRSPKIATLLFIQSEGTYPHKAFECDAVWSTTSNSYSCSDFIDDGKGVIEEELTIGTLDGQFCNALRDDPNIPGIGDKVLKKAACNKPGEKCSCYQIKIVDPRPKRIQEDMAPPGGGAGTGKNN